MVGIDIRDNNQNCIKIQASVFLFPTMFDICGYRIQNISTKTHQILNLHVDFICSMKIGFEKLQSLLDN